MLEPRPQVLIADEYELLHELGRGGMGAVWVAKDRLLGREVAIKLILTEGHEAGAAHERFAREARTLAGLSSRHVVRIFGS